MNRVIAEYLGGRITDDMCYIPHHPEDVTASYHGYTEFLRFDVCWNWLMSVWDKLRDEMTGCNKSFTFSAILRGQSKFEDISRAIVSVNITEAHRLIYEAIVWLNTNKPAQ